MTPSMESRRPRRGVLPVLLLGLLLGSVSCGRRAEETGQWVTILHTNDIHGRYRPTPASWVDGNPMIGGFPAASDYVRRERGGVEWCLLLDAGDFMTGNPICDLEYGGVRGGGMVAFLNLLGYDAICLGNHDFDHGRKLTRQLVGMAEMPVLSANLFDEAGEHFTGKGYEVFEMGRVRVGVIGLIMEDLPGYLLPGAVDGLRIKRELPTIQKVVDEVDPRTDLIVLLTHIGIDMDESLAERLRGRVDVIVGGHSHTRIEAPEKRHGIVICQAGSNNRYLGRLDVLVRADSVAAYRGHLIPMWVSEVEPRAEVERLAAAFDERIEAMYGEVIGELKRDWFTSSSRESNAGIWIADRLREAAGADMAVINSGGIRKSIPKGYVKVLDIKEMLPFDNVLMRFECTGDEVLKLVQKNAQAAADGAYGILQVSGLRYRWRRTPMGVVVEGVEVGGRPVERNRVYRSAAPDYSVNHSDRYFGFEPRNARSLGAIVTDVIIEAVREAAVIDSRVDGRMRELE